MTKAKLLARLDLVNIIVLMIIINIYDAKTNLSRLIEQVIAGKEVIIAKAGKPVAKLTAYLPSRKKRKSGMLKGKIFISDNFNEESEEINNLFYNSKI